MKPSASLILTSKDVRQILTLPECIDAVECAFRLQAEGKTRRSEVLGMYVEGGGFHIKAGVLHLAHHFFVAKVNGNFPENRQRFGLPAIQGVLVLSDAENGRLLAIMDSTEITALRTGAATAVAAKHLARKEASVVTICGCGKQGRVQIKALDLVLHLRQVFAYDISMHRAESFAQEITEKLCIPVTATANLSGALQQSDVCVTCTPSRQAFLKHSDVEPGTFISAIGTDNPDKQELEPLLISNSKVIVDSLEQCATMGDLHHAINAGLLTRENVHAELGEVIAGKKPGRESPDEVIIFDSTGMALQDAAAAAVVYERAVQNDCVTAVEFAA
jgi:alanine dehydrogenase